VGLPIWISSWLKYCLFRFRPLAFQVHWIWAVAGIWFLIYLFVALVFRRPVQACVDELNRRPATTLLVGILAKVLIPFVLLILAVTVVGVVAVPFIVVALLICAIVGKVALLEWIGSRIGQGTGAQLFQRPLFAFLLGTVLVTLLYLVWVVGLLAFILFGAWGLGVAITAAFRGVRRENPNPAPADASPAFAGTATLPTAATAGMAAAAAGTAAFAGPTGAPFSPPPAPAGTEPPPITVPLPEVLAYPKGGFWMRMCAALLDWILLMLFDRLLVANIPGEFFCSFQLFCIIAIIYFTLFWWWKGTTIGGIVIGLKVVRFDGQHASFLVMLVRALAAAFSIIVLFLGIFWIGWDRDKQGWHDKIAGTVVLHPPRGSPLLCL
jgi:uncharacterized RDD family membrane protein YckC